MNEFKQITKAPLYEMDEEGNVRTINKQGLIIPHPRGSRSVILNTDDGRKSFSIDKLISETFGEENGNTAIGMNSLSQDTTGSHSGPFGVLSKEPEIEEKIVKEKKIKVKESEERKVSNDNPMIEKIMALDCFESVKIWKLHEIGVSNADITILLNHAYDFVIVKTIDKYKDSQKLRDRSDKFKV